MKLIKKPLFWTNVLTLSVTGVMVAGLAFGWTNPKETPPGGAGEVSVTADGKVGVGTVSPTQKLDITGYLIGRSGFCLGKDDLTVVPKTSDGLTSLSATTVVSTTHSTADSTYAVHVVSDSTYTRKIPSGVVHDVTVSADYSAVSTLRTASESGVTTLRTAAESGGLTTVGSGSASGVSTTAYKAVGCRTTWPAPGVGVEKSEAEVVSKALSGFSVAKKPIATYGTPSAQYVNKNRLAKFVTDTPGQETIGNSNVYDDGKTVSVTGDFSISGTWVGGKIPWYYLTNTPKIDCGAGKVLQGIFPTKCVTLASGTSTPPPAPPASCTSTVTSSSAGLPTAICGLSCASAHITAYTGAGTPFMSAIPNPPPSTGTTYICNGKPSPGTSSITCSC